MARNKSFNLDDHSSLVTFIVICILVIFVVCIAVKSISQHQAIRDTHALVSHWADVADASTNKKGMYIQLKNTDLPEDLWGKNLAIKYTRGGFGEMVNIYSAGPDNIFHTSDDIYAVRRSMNMSGIGLGIQEGSKEVSSNIMQGAIEGTSKGLDGIADNTKSSIKEKFKSLKSSFSK